MILSLLLAFAGFTSIASLPPADPNETGLKQLVHCWLFDNPQVERRVYYPLHAADPNDPNSKAFTRITISTSMYHPLSVWDLNCDGITNLADFAILSKCWTGKIQVMMGWTIGGKIHLYRDCRYIKDKSAAAVEIDPNNVCLSCKARKVND